MKFFLVAAALCGLTQGAAVRRDNDGKHDRPLSNAEGFPTTVVKEFNTAVPTYATATEQTWTGTPEAYTRVEGAEKRPPAASQGLDPPGNTTLKDPAYRAVTAFDYQSFNAALYQEWLELDLFHYGIARFSREEWLEAGVDEAQISLLQFMANQETGHAQLLVNIMGPGAPRQCKYNYDGAFSDVRSYIDFNAAVTRWGESGVIGFLSKLNSRDSAKLLQSSIHTEARQQMVFRQFAGAFAMPVFFETGIPQSWAWTLLQEWIESCPPENPRVNWSVFPKLNIENNPALAASGSKSAVSTNRTALTAPGDEFQIRWDYPGKKTGPDNSYITAIDTTEPAKYVLLVSQLNATYVPLENVEQNDQDNAGSFKLPPYAEVFPDSEITRGNGFLNDSNFVVLTSHNPLLTPANLNLVNPYVVAGPAVLNFS